MLWLYNYITALFLIFVIIVLSITAVGKKNFLYDTVYPFTTLSNSRFFYLLNDNRYSKAICYCGQYYMRDQYQTFWYWTP